MADEKTTEKAKYYEWLDLPPDERSSANMPLTQDEYGKANNVSRPTLIKWREKRSNGDFNLQSFLTDNKKLLADALLLAAKNPRTNATALKLFAQLTGDLVEKKEETVKLELTANDRTRIARETINGLRENYQRNGGYCPVCSRPEALRLDAHLDTEPEHTEDREVAAVGISTRPD